MPAEVKRLHARMFFVSDQPPDDSGHIPMNSMGPFPMGNGNIFGTRFIPDPSIKPPECIQNLIDEEEGIMSCGHCRQTGASLRCARCKCVKYCSVDCQKRHFDLHKKNCKSIKKQRDVVETSLARCNDPISNFHTITEMIKLGDLLIKVGYQESDTVENGRLYYQQALKYFVLPMTVYKNGYHHALSSSVEDKILLLIVALGGDDETIRIWCEESAISGENPNPHEHNRILTDKSPRSEYYENTSDVTGEESDETLALANTLDLKLRGLAQDDVNFHIIHLFNLMKSLASYRQNVERLCTLKEVASNASFDDDVSKAVFPYLGKHGEQGENGLSEGIQSTICAIRHFGKESYLVHLRDSIPLQEKDAPKLFNICGYTGGHTNLSRLLVPGSASVGRECLWMILQDLFFESPGLSNVLHEFFPGDEG